MISKSMLYATESTERPGECEYLQAIVRSTILKDQSVYFGRLFYDAVSN
jgi:hypothetical protein